MQSSVIRIAVLIITLVVVAVVLFQLGTIGFFFALLYLLGGVFAIRRPWISVGIFALTGLLGIVLGRTTEIADMDVWGGLAIVLAILSYLGAREKRKQEKAYKEKKD